MTLLDDLLHDVFGFEGFRPHQEDVCRAVASGKSAIAVMPTGAGKTLLYQLPGLARTRGVARRRATLVVSPLVALMTEQVGRLQALGCRAAVVHADVSTEERSAISRAYRQGELDFLYLSPERLAVPGVAEGLGRRPPALIAVDEAHCISHWGHDFRADYRLLGPALVRLRAAARVPVVAVTATATRRVREDILRQLEIEDEAEIFVRGFRRTNLAIQALAVPPHARTEATLNVLRSSNRLPAIVYVKSRRSTESTAYELEAAGLRAKPFHAGLESDVKAKTQAAFQSGEVDVVVATVAFGMGIDKPNVRTVIHAALPDSLESYYQEIGRAGRDGAVSFTMLLTSPSDEETNRFFYVRSYPEPKVLQQIFAALSDRPMGYAFVLAKTGLPQATFDTAIEKLRVHGGLAAKGYEQNRSFTRGSPLWSESYERQRHLREESLRSMLGYALDAPTQCRMVSLVQHFNDETDSGEACGLCDACRAMRGEAPEVAFEDAEDHDLQKAILRELAGGKSIASGTLFEATLGLPRRDVSGATRSFFDHSLGCLRQAGKVRVSTHVFPKENGEKVSYQRVKLA